MNEAEQKWFFSYYWFVALFIFIVGLSFSEPARGTLTAFAWLGAAPLLVSEPENDLNTSC
jgi:hypothetical protein